MVLIFPSNFFTCAFKVKSDILYAHTHKFYVNRETLSPYAIYPSIYRIYLHFRGSANYVSCLTGRSWPSLSPNPLSIIPYSAALLSHAKLKARFGVNFFLSIYSAHLSLKYLNVWRGGLLLLKHSERFTTAPGCCWNNSARERLVGVMTTFDKGKETT